MTATRLGMVLLALASLAGCGGEETPVSADPPQTEQSVQAAFNAQPIIEAPPPESRDKAAPIADTVVKEKPLEVVVREPDAVAVPRPGFRAWKDASGKFEIQAKFLSSTHDTVTLEKLDGKAIRIAKAKLSELDREWVREKEPDTSADDAWHNAGLPAPHERGLTRYNFSAVKIKDPIRRVKQILGSDCELISESEFPAGDGSTIRTEMMEWRDGLRVVHIIFQNGRVAQKSQHGLD